MSSLFWEKAKGGGGDGETSCRKANQDNSIRAKVACLSWCLKTEGVSQGLLSSNLALSRVYVRTRIICTQTCCQLLMYNFHAYL